MPQISTGTQSRSSQISTRMVKDATGVACMAVIAGAIRISARGTPVVSAARTEPSTTAVTAPSRIRPMDRATVSQNRAVATSSHRHASTCQGVGSRI